MDKSFLLQAIQRMFRDIFAERNKELYDQRDLLLHVFEEASAVAESFRKEDRNETEIAVARLFGWLFAFLNYCDIDLATAIFEKYHGCCPNCGHEETCACIGVEAKPQKWFGKKDAVMPRTLDEWQKFFDQIYGNVNRVAGAEKCWLHVEEELGEVSRASRLERAQELRYEIADLFAWLAAFCNRARINISGAIISVYPGRCDVCTQEKCKCPKV
jgi:NTP pyrophosphatase (non-canonical NTP hydrolase)